MMDEEERDRRLNPSGFGSLLHLAVSMALGAGMVVIAFYLGYTSA